MKLVTFESAGENRVGALKGNLVGHFRKPPVYLKPGDTVSVTVEGIGTLTNPVVGPL